MQDYIKAVSSFNLDAAFPNMDSHAYDFRVDKYEPNRVWFTIRKHWHPHRAASVSGAHHTAHWQGVQLLDITCALVFSSNWAASKCCSGCT